MNVSKYQVPKGSASTMYAQILDIVSVTRCGYLHVSSNAASVLHTVTETISGICINQFTQFSDLS